MMKTLNRSVTISAIAVMIVVLGWTGQTVAAEKMTLNMGWEPWAPFTYRDRQNTLTGLDIEIVTTILQNAGYVVQYQEMPWARTLISIENGVIQFSASAMKTPEREAYAYFSDPYQQETYVVFVRKGIAAPYSIKRLQDVIGSSFRLGVMRDSVYGDEFVRLMNDPAFAKQVEDVTTDEQNHKKLLAHRLDGFIQEASRMATDGRASGIFDQVEPLFVIERNDLCVMFSKRATTPEIVKAFNAGLEKIRADGTYQRIFKKYLLDEFNMLQPGE